MNVDPTRLLATLLFLSITSLGGCATSSAQEWAQTAPTIEPTFVATDEPVHLGAIRRE